MRMLVFLFIVRRLGLVINYFITVLLRGIFRVDSCIGSVFKLSI
jgi:hypothetical protein